MVGTKITIEEVAKRADVSIATVSRIINHKDTVKPETRQHVLKVMEEMEFHPKSSGTLADSRSRVILMCVPDFSNPFNSPVIDGVQKAAREHDYDVLLLQSKDFYITAGDYLNILKSNSLAGILILSSAPDSHLLEELCFRCPVVMCSEYAEDYGVSYVSIDDVEAAKKAVNYLISTGCRKIGMMNCNMKFKYARHRERGFMQAMEAAGLPVNQNWISHVTSIDYSLAFSSAKYLLNQPERPDAIFASSDIFALSIIRAAKELHLRIPEDLSIVGFDNIELSVISDPQITTIEQPCFALGFQSCELLVDKIRNPNSPDRQIILDTQLIIRDSTKM